MSLVLYSDLPNVSEVKETSIPLVFIDTAGCGLHELETGSNESKGNEGACCKHMYISHTRHPFL